MTAATDPRWEYHDPAPAGDRAPCPLATMRDAMRDARQDDPQVICLPVDTLDHLQAAVARARRRAAIIGFVVGAIAGAAGAFAIL